ncbi:hypothetical protein UPYG_G00225520 [Umbra pygmaea]|uniref:C2H2-type domain-containing protein n=1 Tax=Umbra pygmaea TaxID=75934 RepID=A0ABD0WHF2_UMBPY
MAARDDNKMPIPSLPTTAYTSKTAKKKRTISERGVLNKKELDKARAKTRINIGSVAFPRWKDLLALKGMKFDSDLALYLLERYAASPQTVSPPASKYDVIVNIRCLLQLFQFCEVCRQKSLIKTTGNSTCLSVTQHCHSCNHLRIWASNPSAAQPTLSGNGEESRNAQVAEVQVALPHEDADEDLSLDDSDEALLHEDSDEASEMTGSLEMVVTEDQPPRPGGSGPSLVRSKNGNKGASLRRKVPEVAFNRRGETGAKGEGETGAGRRGETETRGEERLETRGEERLETRGEERLETRGEERLATRGEERLASRAEERLASRAEERLASRAEERLASRAEERLASRAEESLASRAEESLASRAEESLASRAEESLATRAEESLASAGSRESLATRAEESLATRAEESLATRAEESLATRAEEEEESEFEEEAESEIDGESESEFDPEEEEEEEDGLTESETDFDLSEKEDGELDGSDSDYDPPEDVLTRGPGRPLQRSTDLDGTKEYKYFRRYASLCPKCGVLYNPKQQYRKCDHKSMIQCPDCGKGCANENGLKSHQSREHKEGVVFPCKFCLKPFKTRLEKKNHQKSHRSKKRNRMFSCSDCPLKFDNATVRNRHLRQHKKHICQICDKEFKKPHLLDRHKLNHSDDKPYKCTVCQRAFAQGSQLKSHLRVHTGERPFQCQLCDKSFNHNVSLKNHVRRYHKPDSGADPDRAAGAEEQGEGTETNRETGKEEEKAGRKKCPQQVQLTFWTEWETWAGGDGDKVQQRKRKRQCSGDAEDEGEMLERQQGSDSDPEEKIVEDSGITGNQV